MEPPIHTEYFLSGGAMILIFIVGGANAVISFCIRSAMPKNYVVIKLKELYDQKTSAVCHLVLSYFLTNLIQKYYFSVFTKEITNCFPEQDRDAIF